jgi:hypothetical protein
MPSWPRYAVAEAASNPGSAGRPLDIGVELLAQRLEVAAVIRVDRPPENVGVLLRHR